MNLLDLVRQRWADLEQDARRAGCTEEADKFLAALDGDNAAQKWAFWAMDQEVRKRLQIPDDVPGVPHPDEDGTLP